MDSLPTCMRPTVRAGVGASVSAASSGHPGRGAGVQPRSEASLGGPHRARLIPGDVTALRLCAVVCTCGGGGLVGACRGASSVCVVHGSAFGLLL